MKFLKKMKKRADRLERKHLHELVLMTGAMALLLTVMVFMRVGAPSVVRAAYVAVTATYDAFYPGDYTYIRATGTNADQCVVYYYYSWGVAGHFGPDLRRFRMQRLCGGRRRHRPRRPRQQPRHVWRLLHQ